MRKRWTVIGCSLDFMGAVVTGCRPANSGMEVSITEQWLWSQPNYSADPKFATAKTDRLQIGSYTQVIRVIFRVARTTTCGGFLLEFRAGEETGMLRAGKLEDAIPEERKSICTPFRLLTLFA